MTGSEGTVFRTWPHADELVGDVEDRNRDVNGVAFQLEVPDENVDSGIANVASVDVAQQPETEEPEQDVDLRLACTVVLHLSKAGSMSTSWVPPLALCLHVARRQRSCASPLPEHLPGSVQSEETWRLLQGGANHIW